MPFWFALLLLHLIMMVGGVGAVLRSRRAPASMTAWIFAIITLPLVGVWVYWLIGSNRAYRKVRRRQRKLRALVERVDAWTIRRLGEVGAEAVSALPPDLLSVERLAERLTHQPVTGGNLVAIYDDSNEYYVALEELISGAKHHVHLLFYIWQPDETGRRFRDLVIERARAGIECRLLFDAVGCWSLGSTFLQPLREAGVKIAMFLPLIATNRRISAHLRNHRKIAIADGRVALIGSQNIGDEYRGRLKHLSPWIDSNLRIEGPAVLFLQQTFAEDWLFATHDPIDDAIYFPAPLFPGSSTVQIVPTGPDLTSLPLEQIILAAVSVAKRRVRIAVPYFVPSESFVSALAFAVLRGVEVDVVIPTRTDNSFVLYAARSFYREVIGAGVRVFEFDGGFLHSKLISVDDSWCLLGSANMDVRSFRLNFEISALIYDSEIAAAASKSIQRWCDASREITQREAFVRPLRTELLEGAARLFAPLL